jgi:hypothetical protein
MHFADRNHAGQDRDTEKQREAERHLELRHGQFHVTTTTVSPSKWTVTSPQVVLPFGCGDR